MFQLPCFFIGMTWCLQHLGWGFWHELEHFVFWMMYWYWMCWKRTPACDRPFLINAELKLELRFSVEWQICLYIWFYQVECTWDWKFAHGGCHMWDTNIHLIYNTLWQFVYLRKQTTLSLICDEFPAMAKWHKFVWMIWNAIYCKILQYIN